MLRDTRTAFWLPFAHVRHGAITRRRARTCWFVTGKWLHVEPTCVAWFLHCGLHCCFRKLFATHTLHCQTWHSICFVLTFGEHVHRYMKHQCSMRRLTITGGSEKAVRVSRRMDCRFGVIKSHVSNNKKNLYVSWLMCHVYKFMWYSFVELKLKINTRSLFNRTLNRAHHRCSAVRSWPWRVFSSWLASRDLGTTRSSYLAWVGSVIMMGGSEVYKTEYDHNVSTMW